MHPNHNFIEKATEILHGRSENEHYFILYMDITDFQYINYCYGPEAGDALLGALDSLAGRLPHVLLHQRLFSDYFLCLLSEPEGPSDEQPEFFIGRLLQVFLSEQQIHYPACKLKLACGICRIRGNELSLSIEKANLARKEAKRLDSGKVVLYSENLAEQVDNRYELEQSLNFAIKENRIFFYLQPKVDLLSGRIIGAEALARCIDRDNTVIYPDKFLSLMESTGAIVELDLLICRQVCAFLSDRLAKNLPVVRTSVNLSRLHIQNEETAALLHSIALEYRISPALLEFELTETILLDELSGAKRLIDRLRAYGYHVSIDDFGSGYAGINLWQELDFDCLKLDGRFLSDEPVLKKKNEALVPNLINIGHRLNTNILCEGVETAEQCRYLMRLGCTVVQGYYFSRPLVPDEFYKIYQKQNGCYPLPFQEATNQKEPAEIRFALKEQAGKHTKKSDWYIPVAFCSVFLALCITLAFFFYHNLTGNQFRDMVLENLDAYTNGQKADILSEFDNVSTTLEALSILVAQRMEPVLIDACLFSLNENDSSISYTWLSAEDLEPFTDSEDTPQEDLNVIRELMQGKTVISNIVYSHRLGDIYCYAVAAPVFIDGEFSGALRSVIRADTLTSTSLFAPSQGSVIDCFITDNEGTIIPTVTDDENQYRTLAEYINGSGIDQKSENSILPEDGSALATGSWQIGTKDKSPVYLSIADLGINDWHFTVFYSADRAAIRSNHIIRGTFYCTAALFLAVVVAYLILFRCMKGLLKKFSLEEQRYLLLEQFSDTVLFDYDCRKDTIRFTPNAGKLFKLSNLVQEDFLHSQDLKYVYGGDWEAVHTLLSGRSIQKEIRIRLLHPTENRYFWCLVQFRHIYENGRLVSIVGKITDIDEQKLHEDYLVEISEKDGLTGLRNKASSEAVITGKIASNSNGTLFMIDVDNFKHINDQDGHAAGDQALIFLAECMRKTFRTDDILGRIGGDELIAYMDGIQSRDVAQKKVELLMYYIRQSASKGISFTSISIGIAICPEDGSTYEELFAAGDQAMYKAKSKGKQQFCFYDD